MLNPTFTIKLNQQIYSGLAVAGKFDGKTPSLACATTGGKILLHSPHDVSENTATGQLSAVKYLNLNRKISALAAGSLGGSSSAAQPDLLFVGTQSNLLAYDVERNADSFFVDVQDGVNCLAVGKAGGSGEPLIIAGGNCSVLGFNSTGAEAFWTVTGDNVSSIAVCDIDGTGKSSLLVGSDDFEIRVFKDEELISETTEAEKVNFLTHIKGANFAYGLANGTIGVYSSPKVRAWRVKTKNKVRALHAYDLDLDGVKEIFSGWSNGNFNVRRQNNGEVIFKENMGAPVSAILTCDYRMDGKEEVMICAESGEVKAYLSTDVEFGTMFESGVGKDNAADQKALNDLQAQKLELMSELKLLEKSLKSSKAGDVPVGVLPTGTELSYSVQPDDEATPGGAVALRVEVNTDVQIVNLIAVDLEGVILVDKEVVAIAPRSQSKVAVLPLQPSKYMACKMRVQTHVATRSLGAQLHVFESDVNIPKFAMFKQISPIPIKQNEGTAYVSFVLRESADRVADWLKSCFIVPNAITDGGAKLRASFVAVCNLPNSSKKGASGTNSSTGVGGGPDSGGTSTVHSRPDVTVYLNAGTDGEQSVSKVRICCNNMDVVAEMIQDMIKFFKMTELESEADFPVEMAAFEEVINEVAECNAARLRLAADMADDSQRIKALVIRAEDSRLMGDMIGMRRAYNELGILNGQLTMGYNVRQQNHERLLAALKEVNQMIQKAANLRTGRSKARVISDCRAAVKTNNMQSLFRIIKQGYEPNNGPLNTAQPK